jgi:hypothetical protein
MVSKNNMRTVPGALALMLLSVSVVSVIAISVPVNVSGQGVPGAPQADTGLASPDDTTSGQPGGGAESSPCTPTEIGGASGQNTTTTNATTAAGSTNSTTVNNTGISGGEGVSPSTSEIRDHIEQACIALEVGDTEGALMQLNFALDELGGSSGGTQGNDTTTSLSEGEGGGGFNEGVSIGGTGPIDDYDATPDAGAG